MTQGIKRVREDVMGGKAKLHASLKEMREE